MEYNIEETSAAAAAVVIDIGSDAIRAGFSDQSTPQCTIPTVVGRLRYRGALVGLNVKDCYVGEEAVNKIGLWQLRYPTIPHGIVHDWNDIEKLWHHMFYEKLQIAPEQYAVLLSEPPSNPLHNREKMTQIMFETFGVRRLFVANQGVLSLRATGRTSGVVVDCGHIVSHITPVHQGHVIQKAVRRLDIGGYDITEYLTKLLVQRGYSFACTGSMAVSRSIARDIKERFAYVALDFNEELAASERSSQIERLYELPDGMAISIGSERFRCSELIFLGGRKKRGLDGEVFTSLSDCDGDLREELCSNIVLAGGATLCNGFAERLQKSIQQSAPSTWNGNVKVIGDPERRYSTWIGGARSVDQVDWITKEDYDELGPSIVHKKCP